jgi:PhnB protein
MEKANKNKPVRAVPEGYQTVTPYIVVDNAQKFIEFTKQAFNATQTFIAKQDDGRIMHATVKIGDSTIMISDTMEGMQPQVCMLYLYLENVDEVYKKALNAKGTSVHEPTDEFYGDRAAAVKDQWGNVWWIATHVEDVDDAEMQRRARQFQQEQKEKHETQPH